MHEVKGVWFVSARAFLVHQYDDAVYRKLLEHMPEWARVLDDANHSEWYPEEALQNMLQALDSTLARGNEDDFTTIMRRSTHHGIGKFFRILIRLGSASFVLRNVPTMWNRIRRGPGGPEVETEFGRSIVRYRSFPYFGNPLYRLLSLGSLQGLVEAATGQIPAATILDHGPEHLDIEIVHPEN